MRFINPCPFKPFPEVYEPAYAQQFFMRCAYNEALKAWALGEVPIGAIAVVNHQIVARAHNRVETKKDATCHAEMEILRHLSKHFQSWRLTNVTLYVTKEPCPMCSGAIYKARIPQVVIGTYDPFQGCLGGRIHFNHALRLYHKVQVSFEPLQGACEILLKTFFNPKRTPNLNENNLKEDN